VQQIEINQDIFESDLGLRIFKALMQGAVFTFNSGLYVSSLKLLLSAVDTMSFLATGNNCSEDFKEWINNYVDLSVVGVTADELWEHRNALLHMTTLDSRKVKQGRILRLIPYKYPAQPPIDSPKNTKFYSIEKLWLALAEGFDRFVKHIESNDELKRVIELNFDKIVYDEPTILVKS
jgi:hypothetical protein